MYIIKYTTKLHLTENAWVSHVKCICMYSLRTKFTTTALSERLLNGKYPFVCNPSMTTVLTD